MTSTTSRPKLIIFDCDGVLVDSEPLSIRVLVETMASLGVPMSARQCYELFLGRSFMSMKLTLLEKFNLELTDKQIEGMRTQLSDLYRRELLPIAGVARTLETLAIPCCVASSSFPDRIRLSLEVTGLSRFFGDHIFSASMVANGKPAPDLFLHAASRMGQAPKDCLVIEDSPAGLEAARTAAMRSFAFLGGSHAASAGLRETIAPMRPTCIFERMEDLPRLISELSS